MVFLKPHILRYDSPDASSVARLSSCSNQRQMWENVASPSVPASQIVLPCLVFKCALGRLLEVSNLKALPSVL